MYFRKYFFLKFVLGAGWGDIQGAAQKHVMLSYQWGVQELCMLHLCIVNELRIRGYRIWFDLDNIKESTVDAMPMPLTTWS